MKKRSTLAVALLLVAQNGFSEGHNKPTGNEGPPLYKMAGREVIFVPGASERTVHENPTGLVDRSIPTSDPSSPLNYHFELKEFVHQQDLVKAEVGKDAKSSLLKSALALTSPGFGISMLGAWYHSASPEDLYANAIKEKNASRLSLLSIHKNRYAIKNQKISDGLTLVNSDYEFYGISDRKFGYCWGFATLARKLSMLAFFEPRQKAPVAYVRNGLYRNEEWFRFYEKILDKLLLQNEPQVIPGFSSLRELTQIPEIEFYLKLRAMTLWADVATHLSSGSMFLTGEKEMDDGEIKKLTNTLKNKTSRGELVKILFAAKNSEHLVDWEKLGIAFGAKDIHAVLVTGVETKSDGTGKIYLWDINFYAEDYTRKYPTIDIYRDGGKLRLKFDTWFETLDTQRKTDESAILGQVHIAPEYAKESGTLMGKLERFCKSPKTSKYCAK